MIHRRFRNKLLLHIPLGVLCATALCCSAASAEEWGSIKGRFVYEGSAKAEPITPNKDTQYCGVKEKLMTESVDVGEKGALQNVFVYLALPRGKTTPIHPDYEKAELKPAVLDNKGCRFEPHAQMMWTKQKLEVRNSDQGIGHNTNGQLLLQNPQFNETVPSDRPLVKDLKKSEPMPTQFTCSIHPWMNAFVLIRDNPYMAVSAEDGSFEINNIPAGPQQFAFWHEVKSYLRNLEVGEVKTDRKGIAKVDVPAGGTLDLGEIKVSAAILGK